MAIEKFDEEISRASRLVGQMLDSETPDKQVQRLAKDPVLKMFPGLLERVGRERSQRRKDHIDAMQVVRSYIPRKN